MGEMNRQQETRDIKELLNDLDRIVNRLAWHKLYDYADRLEEFVGDLEEELLKRRVEL